LSGGDNELLAFRGAEDRLSIMRSFDLVRVVDVRYVRDHVLWLAFSDGTEGEADLSDGLVGPVFAPLRDPREFARVRIGAETIEWPNGADWAPETLHARVLASKGLGAAENDDELARRPLQSAHMPELSRFYGIVITMFYVDHARPHFHARCGGESIAIEIDGDGMRGSFPPSRLSLVFEWRELHRAELRENWMRMRAGEPAVPIEPLR
jgi:hypothetical protein